MTDDTALKAIVTTAIFQSLEESKREELIKGAIATLLSPTTSTYGYGQKSSSPLQEAFNLAVQSCARDLVFEEVRKEDSAVRAKLKTLVGEALGRLVLSDDDTLATSFAAAIVSALRDSR